MDYDKILLLKWNNNKYAISTFSSMTTPCHSRDRTILVPSGQQTHGGGTSEVLASPWQQNRRRRDCHLYWTWTRRKRWSTVRVYMRTLRKCSIKLRSKSVNQGSADLTNELPHDKTNKMAYAPSEGSDQPGHLPSQIFYPEPQNNFIYWSTIEASGFEVNFICFKTNIQNMFLICIGL